MPILAQTRRAFSLLEMMLVLLIITTLVGIVVVNMTSRSQRANIQTTTISMKQIENALKEYHFNNGGFPTTNEGLAVLVPDYLERLPRDAWKEDFEYISPTGDPARPYMIISMGPDREPGTEDDIINWDIE